MLCSCSIMKQEVNYTDPQHYEFKKKVWEADDREEAFIIAIHGYNDYSNSFQIPAAGHPQADLALHQHLLQLDHPH